MIDDIRNYSLKFYNRVFINYFNNNFYTKIELKRFNLRMDEIEWQSFINKELSQFEKYLKNKNGLKIEHKSLGRKRKNYEVKFSLETLDDYIYFLDLNEDFQNKLKNYNLIKTYFPNFQISFPYELRLLSLSPELTKNILDYIIYFQNNPDFITHSREIPLPGGTKFFETNKNLFIQFEKMLKIHISWISDTFEPLVRFRLPSIDKRRIYNYNIYDISIPLNDFIKINFPQENIFIVENKLTFLKFPLPENSILIHGEGYFFKKLYSAKFLFNKNIYYFGDLDIDGLIILSGIRKIFPNTKSFLMDREIYNKYKEFAVKDKNKSFNIPDSLDESEKDLFSFLNYTVYNRLEQEKIPITEISEWLKQKGKF